MELINKIFFTIFVDELLVFIPLVLLFFYSIYSYLEKKNHFKNFLISLLPLFFLFYHYSYLPEFFSSIGQDSISELNADLGEAFFYIKTFFSFLLDPEIFKRNRFWLIFGSSLTSAITIYLILKYYFKIKNLDILILNRYFNFILSFVLVFGLYLILSLTKTSLDVGKYLTELENNFKKNILNYEIRRNSNNVLNSVIYVGESTSALNLSLYGYPFETTPSLKSLTADKKFIKFNRVYASHTHTVDALLSAFSLCINQPKEDCSLIHNHQKNNLSIVDVLNTTDIKTYLFSTQGSYGGHNHATKLVLNTKKQYYPWNIKEENSNDSRKFLGNRYKPKIKEHIFFNQSFCQNKDIFKDKNSSLSVLHSYAGHGQYGGYLDTIPDKKEFKYPNYINKKNFLGKDFRNFKLISEYDSAIKYIDKTVKDVFNCASLNFEENSQPMIFIYFSDHGESPATARGHDSSRLTYEMLHVPFIIIFNDSAYNLYKDKFDKLKKLENQNLSLKVLGDIILYLNDIDVLNKKKEVIYKSDKFKSLYSKYIYDRINLEGVLSKIPTFWNYEKNSLNDVYFEENFLKKDTSIPLWQLSNFLKSKNLSDRKEIKNLICKHRANSFITQYQAALLSGCFETDIIFQKDKALSTHGIQFDTNLIIDDFFKSSFQKSTIWLDSKNINNVINCNYSLDWLKKNSENYLSVLVETPTSSIEKINNDKWKDCIQDINSQTNVEVAYYMPTNLLKNCNTNNLGSKKKNDCEKSIETIFDFLNETQINSITFDFLVYKTIKKYKKFENYKWHIWHLENLNSFNEVLTNENIGIMLLKNDKFSNNLN